MDTRFTSCGVSYLDENHNVLSYGYATIMDKVNPGDIVRTQSGQIVRVDYVFQKGGEHFMQELYDAITDFADGFGCVNYGDSENLEAYDNLVDIAIKYGKIPECNRYDYYLHSGLNAAIAYETDRENYCKEI